MMVRRVTLKPDEEMGAFTQLPNEVLLHIIAFLGPMCALTSLGRAERERRPNLIFRVGASHLCALEGVNRAWQQIARDDDLWKAYFRHLIKQDHLLAGEDGLGGTALWCTCVDALLMSPHAPGEADVEACLKVTKSYWNLMKEAVKSKRMIGSHSLSLVSLLMKGSVMETC